MDSTTLPQGEALDMTIADQVMGYERIFDSILGTLWVVEKGQEPIETPAFSSKTDEADLVIKRLAELEREYQFCGKLAELTGKSVNNLTECLALLDDDHVTPTDVCHAALMAIKE